MVETMLNKKYIAFPSEEKVRRNVALNLVKSAFLIKKLFLENSETFAVKYCNIQFHRQFLITYSGF